MKNYIFQCFGGNPDVPSELAWAEVMEKSLRTSVDMKLEEKAPKNTAAPQKNLSFFSWKMALNWNKSQHEAR